MSYDSENYDYISVADDSEIHEAFTQVMKNSTTNQERESLEWQMREDFHIGN